MLSTPAETVAESVDLAFALQGRTLARNHALALRDALCAVWPALALTPQAGIHPLKLVAGAGPQAWLAARTRLLLRVPPTLAQQMIETGPVELQVGEDSLRLDAPHIRPLLPHTTLYAYHVVSDDADETKLGNLVDATLAQWGVHAQRVCGQYHQRPLAQQTLHAFSLMLHGLNPADSLRVQQHGLGPHRLLGCGLFVPHKSAAAV